MRGRIDEDILVFCFTVFGVGVFFLRLKILEQECNKILKLKKNGSVSVGAQLRLRSMI